MREAKFICPKCGCSHMMEVLSCCTVYCSIGSIYILEDEPNFDITAELLRREGIEDDWNFDGGKRHFECSNCGYILNIATREQLAKWLVEYGEVEPEEPKCVEPRKE